MTEARTVSSGAVARQLILASANAGKLREFRQLLEPLHLTIVPQSDLGIGDAKEPHCTFLENALSKARHAARHGGRPALADDSGICVDALHGQPGIKSARFAGEPRSDARNNEKLVRALEGVANRRAHYYCVIVLVRDPDDPEPLVAEGRWHGEVIDAPRGSGGFGYDPHFFLPGLGRTAAELEADHKNRISHRGQAARRLVALLQELWKEC
jgi:XTP/dITP diphosphohydrolase